MYSRIKISALIVCIIFILQGASCSLPYISNSDTNGYSLSSLPYETKAANTEEILNCILESVQVNQMTCNINIPDKALIDVDFWLKAMIGLEEIHCGYKKVSDGYNLSINVLCWDNYAIMYAFNSKNDSYLTDNQRVLYNKYCDVISNIINENMPDWEKELVIHDYLVENISYVPQSNTRYNAYNALINGEAVCSGYTECFKTFMDMLGIENSTVSGVSNNEKHIWNQVKLDGEWYNVDVTWDDPINSNQTNIDHSYFNITDEDIKLDHSLDENQTGYHAAYGTRYSYVNIKALPYILNQIDLNKYIQVSIGARLTNIEFQGVEELDIKEAVNKANVTLSYTYRAASRKMYCLYYVTFSY